MSQLTDNLNLIVSIKSDIKSAIENKGVDMTNVSFGSFADKIGEITTSFVTVPLSVSVNGTYTPGQGVDGFSQVEVDVQPELQNKTVVENGEYIADQGYYGLGTVTVSVPSPQFVTESLSVSVNGTYTPSAGVDGFSQVVVDVSQSVSGFTVDQVLTGTLGISVLNSPVNEMKTIGCWSDITVVSLPNLTQVPMLAFDNAINLSQVYFPNVTIISESAFRGCTSITSMEFPNCVEMVYNVFYECSNLTEISLPKCEVLGNDCFAYCERLSRLSLPALTRCDATLFGFCGIEYFSFPSTCKSCGWYTFSYCSSLSQVVMPIMCSLNGCTFYECPSLTEVTINPSNYIIPQYMETFMNTPFNNGSGSIYVNANMLEKWQSAEGWSQYSSLFVGVGDSTSTMISITNDGLLYGYTNYAYWYVSQSIGVDEYAIKSVSLPNCEVVDDIAFQSNMSLTTVDLPTCKKVGWKTFGDCPSLQNVSLPMCEFIDNYAFTNCSSLTTISLPVCKAMLEQCFAWCSSLSEVNLPVCSRIGPNPFAGCSSLTKLILGSTTVCSTNYIQFENRSILSIMVPSSLVDAYKSALWWSDYSDRIFPIE